MLYPEPRDICMRWAVWWYGGDDDDGDSDNNTREIVIDCLWTVNCVCVFGYQYSHRKHTRLKHTLTIRNSKHLYAHLSKKKTYTRCCCKCCVCVFAYSVCMCVFVLLWESERERGREGERAKGKIVCNGRPAATMRPSALRNVARKILTANSRHAKRAAVR